MKDQRNLLYYALDMQQFWSESSSTKFVGWPGGGGGLADSAVGRSAVTCAVLVSPSAGSDAQRTNCPRHKHNAENASSISHG